MTIAERLTHFDVTGKYRYTLWRQWDQSNLDYIAFIGLNPSTADEVNDDPTIRRCIGFAQREGMGGLCMLNIFAFRATDPKVMKAESNPIGSDFDRYFYPCVRNAKIVIAAWGTHGIHNRRGAQIANWLPIIRSAGIYCLGKTKDGHPKHPLYLRADSPLIPFP